MIGCVQSLQRRGGKLLHTPLSKEGALNGFQLWSGLRVLQGRVGCRHCTLQEDGEQSNIKNKNGSVCSWEGNDVAFLEAVAETKIDAEQGRRF